MVIYALLIDLYSSELWACSAAHEIFCFRKKNQQYVSYELERVQYKSHNKDQ